MSTRSRRRPNATRSITKTNTGRRRSSRVHPAEKEELCPCGSTDIGSPMLRCGECHRWYHFRCADLTERDAEELAFFICASCAMSTGKKSREHWELDDTEVAALPSADEHEQSPPQTSDDEAGSEDNFVAEPEEIVPAEDPLSDHSDEGIAARIHKRAARKRKSVSKQADISAKRHKAIENATSSPPAATTDDPIRKSCLEILIKLLTPIFSERLPNEPEPPAHAVGVEQFATELEACIFGIYGDQTDFDGKLPGNKYKERIRMLNFNLGKRDRKKLRQSIRVGRISPDELSRMSSIDLANSQAQQEAHKLAEEAMNHSILQARTAPLRKITHKGEQVIEQSQDEENWRIQEEEAARERERELQRSRSNTIGSVNDVDKPRVRSHSNSFAGTTFPMESDATHTHVIQSPEKSFDPASAVFKVDFDGDGPTLHEHGPPTPPGLSGEPVPPIPNVLDGGPQMTSPTSTSASPLGQNFSLDGIFGSSEPVASMWNDIRESEGSVSGHSHIGDDTVAPPDDADFDAFITVDEDEVPKSTTPKEDPIISTVDAPPTQSTSSLVDIKTIWEGHVGMPSMNDPSHMVQFKAEFKQIAGAPFHDIEANRKSLFPLPLFEIIGRVPTSQAVNYLVSMRLNPTKELFACVLAPNEDDKIAYFELHKILTGKDRYGLVFPWGQDPPLSAPGKELYIAPLLPEHPIPEYLQLLDNVNIPVERDGPIFCGIFVLSKGRVTTLDVKDIPHPTPPVPVSSTPPASLLTGAVAASNSLAPIPPALPNVDSPLTNLSENSLATLSKDLANLTPSQLELVRSLLIQQPAPAVAPPVQSLVPIPPPAPTTISHQHVPSRRAPPHQGSGSSGSFQPPAPPPSRSPTHTSGPLHWDRPRASYPDHGWEPGPGPVRYGHEEYNRDEFGRDDFGRDDFRRDDFRRDDFRRDDFGRGEFAREDFGRGDFPRGDFRRDEFRRDDFRRDDFMRDDFGREARDDWPPYGRHDPRDDRPVYRGRGSGAPRFRGRGRGGPPGRW